MHNRTNANTLFYTEMIIVKLKKITLLLFCIYIFSSCVMSSYAKGDSKINYHNEMRNFVKKISAFAKGKNPSFNIIPQNGTEIAWEKDSFAEWDNPTEKELAAFDRSYFAAIDGIGREDMFYSASALDTKNSDDTTSEYTSYFFKLIKPYQKAGVAVLAADYAGTPKGIADSYTKNDAEGFIGFAAPYKNLTLIPETDSKFISLRRYYPNKSNKNDIKKLGDAKNFLFLLNAENYLGDDSTGKNVITALQKTDYDILIIDPFIDAEKGIIYSFSQINLLKKKYSGGKRLVIAYLSIGEAEAYRDYWNTDWVEPNGTLTKKAPFWLSELNTDWAGEKPQLEGNYKVKYWNSDWQKIVFNYLDKIVTAGFDGVYLDIIDAFEYFENKK